MEELEELKKVMIQMSQFLNYLEKQAQSIQGETEQQAEAMNNTLRMIDGKAAQMSVLVVDTVKKESRLAIEEGAKNGLGPALQQVKSVQNDFAKANKALEAQLKELRAAQRAMTWKAGIALLVGSALAVGGTGYWVWKSQQTLKQAKFPTAVLDATRSGTITQCSEGVLCARADKNARRFGKDGEYIEIK